MLIRRGLDAPSGPCVIRSVERQSKPDRVSRGAWRLPGEAGGRKYERPQSIKRRHDPDSLFT
jgi:hypothetical protein